MLHASVVLIAFLLGTSSANNDWSQPCLSGVCQYDLPSNGSSSGTLKIWGPESAISDITPAAGWQVIDCSPSALQQDIRLVCASGSSNCAHLYDGSSNLDAAVGKVVRLPENCGKSAFAVVTKSWTPQDQSIPSNVSFAVKPSNGTQPAVRALHLSTSFSSVQPSSAGPVNFVLQAANIPGASGDLQTSVQQQRRSNSRIFGRSLKSFVTDAVDDISSLDDFNVNKSTTLPPVDVDKSFNLVDKSISCPPVDASVKIDVDAKAHAVATIGVAASGTVVPPKVSDFALIAGLNADIDGSLDMKASASGTLDSGKIKLFSVGIPGLDFPGILTIGPSFDIDGQTTATLDLDVDMTVGITYSIENAQFTFPPKGSSKGSFNIGDTPLKLSASPSATASGTVAAHLIPTLNFGISALDDAVGANVFLALDASASMTLTGQASAEASKTVNTRRSLGRFDIKGRQFDDSEDSGFDDSYSSDFASPDDTSDDDGTEDEPTNGGEDNNTAPGAEEGQDFDDDTSSADSNDGSPDESASTSDSSDANAAPDQLTDGANVSSDNGNDDLQSDALDDSDPSSQPSANSGSEGSDDAEDGSVEQDDGSDSSDALGDSADEGGDSDAAVDGSPASTSSEGSSDGSESSDNANGTPGDTTGDTDTSSSNDDSSDTASGDATSTADQSADNSTATHAASNVLTSVNTTFGGCFSVDGALDVNAGADGDFFGLFNPSTKVDLFNKKFEIFKKCFGSNPPKRRSLRLYSRSHDIHSLLEGRAISLTCPSASAGAGSSQESVVNETVPTSEITEE